MKSIDWNVQDEWQPLEAVMVGIGNGMGPVPKLEETYDPQSRKHVQDGTYPLESDVTRELDAFAASLWRRVGFKSNVQRRSGLIRYSHETLVWSSKMPSS